MKKEELILKTTSALNKVNFKLKKYSPEILVVSGVLGIIASVVLACKATTKVNDILEESKEKIDAIHNTEPENEEEAKHNNKNLAMVYIYTGARLVKLYAPAIAVGALSITSILASHDILKKRNVALAAAYSTVDKSFKEYRDRVIKRFGERVDYEIKHNIATAEIEETFIDKDGKEKKTKKRVDAIYFDPDDPNRYSEYARFFDESSVYWDKEPGYNVAFLNMRQTEANNRLKADGYLFLNDVYDMLGLPRSKAGQIVGWIFDPENSDGDGYVDFGIYDIRVPKNRDFVNGYERSILLDFNVDGNIWELMK